MAANLLPRDPTAPIRTREFIDQVGTILNSLIRSGVIVQTGPGDFTINLVKNQLSPSVFPHDDEGSECLQFPGPRGDKGEPGLNPWYVLSDDPEVGPVFLPTSTGGGGTPGGADTNIQYNSSSAFAGSADLTWNNTSKLLYVNGALKLDGTTQISFTTPVGNTVSTKILIPVFDPGAFNQIIAFGIPSGTAASARAISLFDNRAGDHQPTITVFSKDENETFGLTWDGTSTIGKLKCSGNSLIAVGATSGGSGAGSTVMRFTSTNVRASIIVLEGNIEPRLGGCVYDYTTDAGNSTTTETDLYSDSIPGNTLAINRDKLEAMYAGVFVSSATATRQIKIYFGGTAIFDTGALTLSLSSAWVVYVSIIRISSSVIRYAITFTTEGAALSAYTSVGELTGLTLSGSNTLKVTGQAAGVGAATNDIVAKMGYIDWHGAGNG